MKFPADLRISSSQAREVTGHVSSSDSITNIPVSFRSSNICSTNVNCANVGTGRYTGASKETYSSFQTRTYSRCHVPGEADGTLHISVSQTSWHHGPLITNTVHPSPQLFHLACPLYATRGSISLLKSTHKFINGGGESVTNDN